MSKHLAAAALLLFTAGLVVYAVFSRDAHTQGAVAAAAVVNACIAYAFVTERHRG